MKHALVLCLARFVNMRSGVHKLSEQIRGLSFFPKGLRVASPNIDMKVTPNTMQRVSERRNECSAPLQKAGWLTRKGRKEARQRSI